jgi:hypothetical protein
MHIVVVVNSKAKVAVKNICPNVDDINECVHIKDVRRHINDDDILRSQKLATFLNCKVVAIP